MFQQCCHIHLTINSRYLVTKLVHIIILTNKYCLRHHLSSFKIAGIIKCIIYRIFRNNFSETSFFWFLKFICAAYVFQLSRKRHIGNDIVTIIFQDPGALPFSAQTVRSHFQHVFLVVRAHNPNTDSLRYRYIK